MLAKTENVETEVRPVGNNWVVTWRVNKSTYLLTNTFPTQEAAFIFASSLHCSKKNDGNIFASSLHCSKDNIYAANLEFSSIQNCNKNIFYKDHNHPHKDDFK